MNWLDPLITGIVLYAAVRGFRRGFLGALGGVEGGVLALLVAYWFYPEAGRVLTGLAIHPALANMLAFLLIMVGVALLAGALGHLAAARVAANPFGLLDRLTGAGLGGLFALLLVTSALVLLRTLPSDIPTQWVDGSYLSRNLLAAAPAVYRLLSPLLPLGPQPPPPPVPGQPPLLPEGGGQV